MAASGINEHHEACRKQHVINRQAFNQRNFMDKMLETDDEDHHRAIHRGQKSPPGHLGTLNTYDVEKLHKGRARDDTDSKRRKAVRQEQYLTYSAKLHGRLSSQDYVQQW